MEKKQYKITFRVEEKDSEIIKEISKKYGFNVSEFARFCVNCIIKGDYFPKSRLLYFIHQILADSELQKNKCLVSKIEELMTKCL